jgi:hypothetical protein
MKIKYLLLFFLLTPFKNNAQNNIPEEYLVFCKQADSLFKIKEYSRAALTYSKAFESFDGRGKIKDRYSAACCWALSNNSDSAFSQLYKIATKGRYSNFGKALGESSFVILHNDQRWTPLIELMKKNKEEFDDATQNQ